jgi:hypothetical protein
MGAPMSDDAADQLERATRELAAQLDAFELYIARRRRILESLQRHVRTWHEDEAAE